MPIRGVLFDEVKEEGRWGGWFFGRSAFFRDAAGEDAVGGERPWSLVPQCFLLPVLSGELLFEGGKDGDCRRWVQFGGVSPVFLGPSNGNGVSLATEFVEVTDDVGVKEKVSDRDRKGRCFFGRSTFR